MSKSKESQTAIRNEVVSIGKKSSVYFIGQALSRAVGFFMIPIYTRFIAPTNYGAMEMIEIIISALAIIIAMGVSESMARFYYAEKDEKSKNLVVSTILIGFTLIAMPIVVLLISFGESIGVIILDDPQYQYFLQVGLATIGFSMLCDIGYTYLRMRYMARLFVSVTITQLIIALSLNIYLVVFKRMDILGIFYSTLITQGLVATFFMVRILRSIGMHISFSMLWRLVSFGLPLVPSRIGLMVGFVSNRFFLRWLGPADPIVALTQVGLFSLGHKFGVIINRFVTVPFNSFWGPRRMELLVKNKPAARETVARVCTYATMLSIYFALLLSSGIESLIDIMADPSYKGAHTVVPYIALAYVALGIETHFSSGIIYCRKTKWLTYISIPALVVVLIWNYIFVPIWGIFGAATSNLAGFVVRSGLIYIIGQRLYPIPFELGRISLMLIVAFAIYYVCQFIYISSPYITFIARTGISALYPLVLFLFGFYKDDEVDLAKKIIQKGRVLVVGLLFSTRSAE